MKRIAYALAAALAASVALTAPSVTAAEQFAPSGSALIRIDGDRAIAKKASDDRYFIVMPAGAEAGWIGPAAGVEGIASGRFNARTLVSSWAGLGHRGRTGVLTTLAWKTSVGQELAQARVSQPRLNAEGRLVFTARTSEPLPRVLPDFSVNISGAPEPGTSSRSTTFPFVGNAIGISGTSVSLNATATAQSSVDYYVYGNCGSASSDPTQWKTTISAKPYTSSFLMTCSGVTFTTSDGTADAPASFMGLTPKTTRGSMASANTEFWIMTSTGVSSTFTWEFMEWG